MLQIVERRINTVHKKLSAEHTLSMLIKLYTVQNDQNHTSSVIRQKSESQNGCFKNTNRSKFSEKLKFLAPWCAPLVFRKICRALFSWNTHFKIRLFILLLTTFHLVYREETLGLLAKGNFQVFCSFAIPSKEYFFVKTRYTERLKKTIRPNKLMTIHVI